METGLLTLGDHTPDPDTGKTTTQQQRFRNIIQQGILAESLGFDAIHIGEHHFCDYIVSVPQMLLAAIAEKTDTIRLSTGVTLLANHDPVRLAEDYASLDVISNGRAELVAGRGDRFVEAYQQMGINIEDSADIYAENLDLLRKLWTETNLSWQGRFRPPLENANAQPRPVQQPHIPIWIGGASKSSIQLTASHGLPLQLPGVFAGAPAFKGLAEMYRSAYSETKHDPANCKVGFTAHIHVRKNSQDAKKHWEKHHLSYLNWVWDIILAGGQMGMEKPAYTAENTFGPDLIAPALCGSPAEVLDKLSGWQKVLGGIDR
ncbi:MAG: LLM class flavin-dependent oxidoreductase, partial [Pseudomonadota bacterium]